MKKEENMDISFYIIGWCCIFIVLLYMIVRNVFHFDILEYTGVCTFYAVTGLFCPGCGGTRSVFALFRGDFLRSLYMHPFVPYLVIVGGWFMLSQTVERISRGKIHIAMHFRMIYVWIAIAIIAANFIWKNTLIISTGNAPF